MTVVLLIVLICVLCSFPKPRDGQEKPYSSDYSLCSALDEKMKFYHNPRMGFLKAYMNLFLPILACFAIFSTYTTYSNPTTTDIEFFTVWGYAVLTVLNIYTIRGIDSIAYYINIFWLICFVALPGLNILFSAQGAPVSDDLSDLIVSAVINVAFLSALITAAIVALFIFLYLHKRRDLFYCTKSELKKQCDDMKIELLVTD